MTNAEKLTEAYHLIYDIKDEHAPGDGTGIRYACYEALQKLQDLMYELSIAAPVRYDGQGRP